MTLALQPRSPTIASMLTAKDAGQGGCSDLLFVDLKTLGTLIGSKYSSKSGGPKVLTTPGHLELRIMCWYSIVARCQTKIISRHVLAGTGTGTLLGAGLAIFRDGFNVSVPKCFN